MVLVWTLGIDMDSWYRHGLMVLTRTHGIDIDSWYYNTNGIDLDSWYRIGTPESHTYERAECYPYVGFFTKDRRKEKQFTFVVDCGCR